MSEMYSIAIRGFKPWNRVRASGFQAEAMHGFIAVVAAGFPKIVYLQSQGYVYITPISLPVKDVRYLEQPRLRPE